MQRAHRCLMFFSPIFRLICFPINQSLAGLLQLDPLPIRRVGHWIAPPNQASYIAEPSFSFPEPMRPYICLSITLGSNPRSPLLQTDDKSGFQLINTYKQRPRPAFCCGTQDQCSASDIARCIRRRWFSHSPLSTNTLVCSRWDDSE